MTPAFRIYQYETAQRPEPGNEGGIDAGDWVVQNKSPYGVWRNFDGPYKYKSVAEARLKKFEDAAASEVAPPSVAYSVRDAYGVERHTDTDFDAAVKWGKECFAAWPELEWTLVTLRDGKPTIERSSKNLV